MRNSKHSEIKISKHDKIEMLEDISLIGKALITLEPYYGLFMLTLNKVINPEVETAGVRKRGINVELAVAPQFWNILTREQKLGLMKHEILHICFNHIIMGKSYDDPILFNLAADIEINQYIETQYLPPDPTTIESMNLGKVKKYAGTDYYYNILKEQKGNNPDLDNMYDQILQDIVNEEFKLHSSHGTWKDFEDMTESEAELVKAQIKHQAKELSVHCKARGVIPAELSDFVEALFELKEATVKWEQLLRRFIGGSKEVFTKKTRRKQSKRLKGNPGLKIKVKPFGAVYWDVSGSVGKDEEECFFSEIKHMHKAGLNFDVIPFNTEILKSYRYKGENSYYSGTGGTSFTPISEHFNHNKHKYSFGVILTDGYAEVPPKFFKPMLWVITPHGHEIDYMEKEGYPGIKIKMNHNVNS